MSEEVKATAIWNGLKVDTYTNLRTGEIKIYQPKQLTPVLLAKSTPGNGKAGWTYVGGSGTKFRNIYNDQQRAIGGKELTQDKFNETFFTTGTKSFNNIRSTILTIDKNYTNAGISVADISAIKTSHFNNSIPGVTDPKSGITVNSDGTKPGVVTTGQQVIDPGAGGAGGGGGGGNGNGSGNNNEPTLSEAGNRLSEDARRGGPKGGTRYTAAKILRYPLGEPGGPFQYDYISITAHDYQPSGLGSNYEADKNLGIAYEKVILPMQPQLSETNAVNWSDDQLNPVQAMMGNFAAQTIGALADLSVDDIKAAFSNLGSDIKEAIKDPNNKAAIAAYFAGQAVGANVLGRSTGTVINPNLELLFNGPNLRTFNFNFRLTPREPAESEEIREIIYAFKRNMSVQRSKSNLFLRSPRLFKLEYIYKGEDEGVQHPYLNKFKPCAMTNFQVNYTPDGSYATYDQTGSLTAYDLTMSFSEVMPIYASDNEYTDNPQDMGF